MKNGFGHSMSENTLIYRQMTNGEHDEKTVELGVSPDGFSRNMERGNKGTYVFLQTILGCCCFFLS
jgi:hypothetical protein